MRDMLRELSVEELESVAGGFVVVTGLANSIVQQGFGLVVQGATRNFAGAVANVIDACFPDFPTEGCD